ncbi:ribosome biogenesis GTPase Der [bacterium]|nr:ribosome biogenesis GTPase Der [bacterium]
MESLPKVVIVGRPNVGKSSLFNRLIGQRKSIVDPQSGVTRDRVYQTMQWDDYHCELIDTGGLDFEKNCSISQRIKEQVDFAINEASVIIFIVDKHEGLNPYDKEITKFLRNFSKPIILTVNKVDYVEEMRLINDFYSLGFDRIFPVSALHGLGIDDLLEEVVSYFPKKLDKIEFSYDKITIVGKPNVGKSTLLNALLNEERAMVDCVPGTTRDIIDTVVTFNEKKYLFVDTAGIRHKKKFDTNVETYAFFRTHDAIKRSDLVLMLIDATAGVTRQDDRIINMATDAGKGMILIFNKWDLVKGIKQADFLKNIEKKIRFISHVPTVFISAKDKKNLKSIFKQIPKIMANASKKVNTPLLNKMVSDALQYYPPPLQNQKRLKIYYAVQTGIKPPTITLFVNSGRCLTDNYKKYLLNKLRYLFDFNGTPVILKTKSK